MITIAIDGPSGSGKSTVSEILAKKLGILYLNTGAIYRAIALYMIRHNITSIDPKIVQPALDKVHVEIKYLAGKQHTYLNNEDVSNLLYTMEVSDASSKFAQMKIVRDKILDTQRDIAKIQGVVMEGRDITSSVLPDAEFKFYLDASAEVRANRRINDEKILAKPHLNYTKVLADIIERDERDKGRLVSPLMQVEDAVYINTDQLTAKEAADAIYKIVKSKQKDKK